MAMFITQFESYPPSGSTIVHPGFGAGRLISVKPYGWEVVFKSGTKVISNETHELFKVPEHESTWNLIHKNDVEKYKAQLERKKAECQREKELNERLARERADKIQPLFEKIDRHLANNYLLADQFFESALSGLVSRDEYEARKVNFVRDWFKRFASRRNDKLMLDDEQITAIANVHGNIQVVARAGSGKTATLVHRTLFLILHCRVPAHNILLLAFNRKAAAEIRRRLLELLHEDAERQISHELKQRALRIKVEKRQRFDKISAEQNVVDIVAQHLGITLPHVMTFHAMAYAIVHPEESILYDGAEGEARALSRAVQTVIDDHLLTPEYNQAIRRLMMTYFKEDWGRIIDGGYDKSPDELLRFRRSLPSITLRGEYVKSWGEKLIADFLFEHDIPYKYEHNFFWGSRNYRPDFTLFKTSKSGVIIEYFGMAGDLDYDQTSVNKREFWDSKSDWALIEIERCDLKRNDGNDFQDLLKRKLEGHGFSCDKLSEDEIWLKIRDRAIDSFSEAAVRFVSRCRKLSISKSELSGLLGAHSPAFEVEAMFLGVLKNLYSAYLDRLEATGEDDFDGLIQRAAAMVEDGQSRFSRKSGSGDLVELQFINIDEFQDFSDLFYRLLHSIRILNPKVNLFCVGDDWQAINGFAGSDLRFFNDFERYIGPSRKLYISTNYRSVNSVVELGNALMRGRGKPARAHKAERGVVAVADVARFRRSLIEEERHRNDLVTPMVLRVIAKSLAEGSNVVLIFRKNSLSRFVHFKDRDKDAPRGLDEYLQLIRSFFPKDDRPRITKSTAHSYKGLQESTVVVMDAFAQNYPLIHPTWMFLRVFGESVEKIIEEERRLLYVAMTRAVEKLVVITDSDDQSPFLEELGRVSALEAITWEEYPALSDKVSRLIVKVGNQERPNVGGTFPIKDLLKACGYQWQTTGWRAWSKMFVVETFDISAIKKEVWVSVAESVEVRIVDEAEKIWAVYHVDNGGWVVIRDELASFLASATDPGAKDGDVFGKGPDG